MAPFRKLGPNDGGLEKDSVAESARIRSNRSLLSLFFFQRCKGEGLSIRSDFGLILTGKGRGVGFDLMAAEMTIRDAVFRFQRALATRVKRGYDTLYDKEECERHPTLFCSSFRVGLCARRRRRRRSGRSSEPKLASAIPGLAFAIQRLNYRMMRHEKQEPPTLGSAIKHVSTVLQVSSGAASTRRYGASMYRELFLEFSDPFSRQEVVGALITHCGAGAELETDSALAALSALATPR